MIALPPPSKVLLIKNDPAIAEEIRASLEAAGNTSFEVEWVRRLSDGLERLNKKDIAAVLLELTLPDTQGIETFDQLFIAVPDIPIQSHYAAPGARSSYRGDPA